MDAEEDLVRPLPLGRPRLLSEDWPRPPREEGVAGEDEVLILLAAGDGEEEAAALGLQVTETEKEK